MLHNLVPLLLLDELAGGWIEDHTESCSSTPSTDFVSESRHSGSASRISLGNTASLMLCKMRPHPTNSNGRGPQHGPHLGQEHMILSGDCSLNLAILVLTKKVTYVAQPCHVAPLLRTGRRIDQRPYGILSFYTLYRLRFRITTFRVVLKNFFG